MVYTHQMAVVRLTRGIYFFAKRIQENTHVNITKFRSECCIGGVLQKYVKVHHLFCLFMAFKGIYNRDTCQTHDLSLTTPILG